MSLLARCFGSVVLLLGLLISQAGDVRAGVILAIDIGDGPVQSGFDAFPLEVGPAAGVPNVSAVSHTYANGITVTMGATVDHKWQVRNRDPIPEDGTFTYSDLLRDFIASQDGFTIYADIAGLIPNNTYRVEVWSFDQAIPLALSDWTANGTIVQEDYVYFQGNPTSNEEYRIVFETAADAAGLIRILGAPTNPTDAVRINAIRVSGDLTPVPEPSSLVVFGMGACALLRAARRRRAPALD